MPILHINKEFKSLIPPLTEEEFAGLEQSILAEGCRDAIIVWQNGKAAPTANNQAQAPTIVDGHNRFDICIKHNISFNTEERYFNSSEEVEVWILSNQLSRRNLTDDQRAIVADELIEKQAKINRERQLETARQIKAGTSVEDPASTTDKQPKERTRKELSAKAKVSERKVKKARKLRTEKPELAQKVRDGEMTLLEAEKKVKSEARQEQRAKKAEEGKYALIENELIDLRCGDFKKVLSDIPDNSIDLILTDPPYPYEFIKCWSELSEFASKKLRNGGFCVAYSGQLYLPEVMQRMGAHLNYYWLCALLHKGKIAQRFEVNMFNRFKPILIYCKGKKQRQLQWIEDVIESPEPSKTNHDWEQNIEPIKKLIDLFEPLTVCDPFMGGGTVAVSCAERGIRFIGSEIDEKTFHITKARVAKCQHVKK
ncbi:MAG: hypothetical protein DDT19_00656 [Syntrophomonadaceae bacterium]|nr:hypothetical protein [Bacillota bacterium]